MARDRSKVRSKWGCLLLHLEDPLFWMILGPPADSQEPYGMQTRPCGVAWRQVNPSIDFASKPRTTNLYNCSTWGGGALIAIVPNAGKYIFHTVSDINAFLFCEILLALYVCSGWDVRVMNRLSCSHNKWPSTLCSWSSERMSLNAEKEFRPSW